MQVNGIEDAIAITVGDNAAACVLRRGGGVSCWGNRLAREGETVAPVEIIASSAGSLRSSEPLGTTPGGTTIPLGE